MVPSCSRREQRQHQQRVQFRSMVAGTIWPFAVLLLGTTAAYAQKPDAPPTQAQMTAIEVRSIAFLSAHGGLSDSTDSYRRGGKLIEAPEWTRSRNLPVTQTGGTHLDLAVVLQADTAADAESVRIVARVRGSGRLKEG